MEHYLTAALTAGKGLEDSTRSNLSLSRARLFRVEDFSGDGRLRCCVRGGTDLGVDAVVRRVAFDFVWLSACR